MVPGTSLTIPHRRPPQPAFVRLCTEREAAPVQAIAVHHVSINVDDVEAALRFYVDVLGLQQREDRPELGIDGAWLDAGGQQVHLIGASAPPKLGQHFALLVEDLDASIADLRAQGITVSDSMQVGTGRQAFLEDPSGNAVELHQVNAAR
jgi:catechol 2,3-dioxygenase-like lactoylglutathione lyase family enzyme